MKFFKEINYSTLIFSVIAIILLFILITQTNTNSIKDITDVQNYWFETIKKDGPESAYKDFVRAYKNKPFGVQHEMAHIFGETLYESVGSGGIRICDSSFAFGCYHGFFSAAISSEGLSLINSFDEACGKSKESPSACRHGIGHGIMEYFGPDHLNEALGACEKTTWNTPIEGCPSGVFMEFNVPMVKDSSGEYFVSSRSLEPKNPYAPCPSVDELFKQSCYHELPHWWSLVYNKDYQKIGALCEEIEDSILKSDCYIGVGNIVAPTTNYSVKETLDICYMMPNQDGESLCRLSAAQGFSWNPKGKLEANKVCSGLEPLNGITCPN